MSRQAESKVSVTIMTTQPALQTMLVQSGSGAASIMRAQEEHTAREEWWTTGGKQRPYHD